MARRGKTPVAQKRPRTPARSSRRRVRGLGISLQMALAFAGTITVLMGLGGIILYGQAVAALDEAVDAFGVTEVRTLALQDIENWHYRAGTYEELRHRLRETLRRYPRWLRAAAGVVPAGSSSPPDAKDLGRERRAVQAHDAKRRRANAARLEGITAIVAGREKIDVDVVDVFIFDRRGHLIAKANPRKASFDSTTGPRNYVAVGSHGVPVETITRIQGGLITLGHRRLPGRSFVQPIYDERGQKAGTVQLILSEDRVAARKRKLALSCLAITVVMLLGGVGVSLLLARVLATPVLKLVDVVEAVARGDLEHRTFGHTRDEIGLLARSIDTMILALKEAEKDQTTLQAREREMAIIAELRRNLLPNEVPALVGFELEASYRPTARVGGNYYDFLALPDGRCGVLVADTAGEGVLAGFTMNLFRGLMHAEMEWLKDPAEMLRRVNHHLAKDIKKGVYVTALLVVAAPGSHELQLVNAGHLPILKWSGAERKLRVASSEGIALGLDPGPIFDARLKATRLPLEKGDRVVLYTEGVYKIQSADGEELGEAGFNKLVSRHAPMHSAAFMNLTERSLERFREGGSETADYTIVTLKAV